MDEKFVVILTVLFLCGGGVRAKPHPADPDSPRPPSPGPSRRPDCSGYVGFSALGHSRLNPSGILGYRVLTFDRGLYMNKDAGTFVVQCPGYYRITFAGYSNFPNTRLILKKRTPKNNRWVNLASAGSTVSGGGSNQVIVSMAENEEAGVWVVGGSLASSEDSDAPSVTFTAERISSPN